METKTLPQSLDDIATEVLKCFAATVIPAGELKPDKEKVVEFIAEYKKQHNAILVALSSEI